MAKKNSETLPTVESNPAPAKTRKAKPAPVETPAPAKKTKGAKPAPAPVEKGNGRAPDARKFTLIEKDFAKIGRAGTALVVTAQALGGLDPKGKGVTRFAVAEYADAHGLFAGRKGTTADTNEVVRARLVDLVNGGHVSRTES